MKKMRKMVGALLTASMVFSMAFSGMAATYDSKTDNDATKGSITINDAVVDQTYTAYQILDLESYDTDLSAYAYKAAEGWIDFINRDDIKDVYVNVDDQGYVYWITKKGEGDAAVEKTQEEINAEAEAFAKLAKAYADANESLEKVTVPATSETVEFANLDLGYYLVDTTLGTLCALDSTTPEVEMYEKNEVPSIDKLVQEDSDVNESDKGWDKEDTAQIGDTVTFKTTVNAKKGAQNYIVHDAMSAGLSFKEVTSVVAGSESETVLTEGTDYIVIDPENDSDKELCQDNPKQDGTYGACDFHVKFTQTYLDSITESTDIVITYTAVLNEDAAIYDDANTNDTKLTYGDGSATEWSHTDTYTFMFDIVKTNSDLELLEGAKFELYDAEVEGDLIPLVKVEEGVYRVATGDEIAEEEFESAIIEAGKVVVKGLDGDDETTYYLEETDAPDGYNKLPSRVAVKLTKEEGEEENKTEVGCNLIATMGSDGITWSEGGVQITNKTGTELPSTGGMGTKIFYVLGGTLVVAAIVLLVTRKRMDIEE